MKFETTAVPGAFVIDIEPVEDERGFFARAWCAEEFAAHGLNPQLAQCSVSFNRRRGTVRGFHLQRAPHEEAKVVRCTRGAVFDVILDLRPASPAYRRWFGVELSGANGRMLYIPEGVAHGFQTLEEDSELFYQISAFYHPESQSGIRWDDPVVAIPWPVRDAIVSDRDRALPALDAYSHGT